MTDAETLKKSTIRFLTTKYVHDLSDCEAKGKRLAGEKEEIERRIASNDRLRLERTIEYGSGIANSFSVDKKPLALYVMISFFKDDGGHSLAPSEVKSGATIKAGRLLNSMDSRLSTSFKRFFVNDGKLEADLKETLAYLEANGFVECDANSSTSKFDNNMNVILTGNGVLAARALKEYIAAKKTLERKQ